MVKVSWAFSELFNYDHSTFFHRKTHNNMSFLLVVQYLTKKKYELQILNYILAKYFTGFVTGHIKICELQLLRKFWALVSVITNTFDKKRKYLHFFALAILVPLNTSRYTNNDNGNT